MGIGGAGMSAIARFLRARGARVSGDDRTESATVAALRAEGMAISIGHDPAHLSDVTILAPSSAVPADEPELVAARAQGLRVWHRGDLLQALIADHFTIAVAGTHGKSTTSAMVATILDAAGLDPSFIIGATPLNFGTNARAGNGNVFVLEADEYDRTFLRFFPRLAVVTNIEFDHPDTFRDFDDLLACFVTFVEQIPADGALVVCAEDAGCAELLRRARPRAPVIEYGFQRGTWQAQHAQPNPLGGMDFVFRGASTSGPVEGHCSLRVGGEHNVLNALAALVVADLCGVPSNQATQALSSYQGASRRFELRGEAGGVRVIDDYAHHPTEIKATLRAARLRYPVARIWAIWEPHTYSRTQALLADFAVAFADADRVVVLPVYAARESPRSSAEDMNPTYLARRLQHKHVFSAASFGDALGVLLSRVRPGDVVITLSAGNGNQVGERLLETLRLAHTSTK